VHGSGTPNAPVDVLEYELVQEQAAALGRLGRALETALAKLREFDVSTPAPDQSRRALVKEAGEALWMFVVQREACGLRDSRTIMRDYNVPSEVMLHSGCPEPVVPQLQRGQRRQRRQISPRVG
jgi:hypothetical protein